MSSSQSNPAPNDARYDGPEAPPEGQIFVDRDGNYWKARKVTHAEGSPRGFFIVHIQHGVSEHELRDSMVLGPREFATLLRERQLKPHFHIV